MRMRSLHIENLRAIESFQIDNLSDFILIAGPNGCGKSTVLDGIRLLKSLYVIEEWRRWFSEFGINVDRPAHLASMFRDATRAITIGAHFELADAERNFLLERAGNIALAIVLNEAANNQATITGDAPLMKRGTTGADERKYDSMASSLADELRAEIRASSGFAAAVRITPGPHLELTRSPVATAAFSCFNPGYLGEIEYHGSRRLYGREAVTTVRLNVGDRTEERRNRFLYDLENKYRNVKSQLSEEFVTATLQGLRPDEAPLQRSIKELFRTFFPGKSFLGVTLGSEGSLSFPVQLSTGETHDIDELSSGEKEIVYGYLWLRTGTPKRSIILVDEPELHLNPALVQGLASFYKTHLADALDAQVWVVTHSDAILREGVRTQGMAVYHMARASGDHSNQAIKIESQNAVEAAVLELIGDLAAYRPYARIVLIEGHKETRFDVDAIRRLFPDYAERANFIPVGNRHMTAGVRMRLLDVLQESGLTGRAVSICDADSNLLEVDGEASGYYVWPAYEIENFLLSPPVLRGAAALMLRHDPFTTDSEVIDRLRDLARKLVDTIATTHVQHAVNGELMNALRLGGDPERPLAGLVASAAASKDRILALDLSHERFESMLQEVREQLYRHLETDAFLRHFPGDRLLRAFAGTLAVSGDHFRNACLDVAQRLGYRPDGMKATLERALS